MSSVGATRLIYTIKTDLLELIGNDCRWLCFFCEIFKRFSAFTFHGCQLESHQPRSAGAFKKKYIRSHVWCLLCLRGRVGEDNTVLHAETVVSCQQSSQSSLKTNFLLVSWEEVLGIRGHYRALKQNQDLYRGFYNFICSSPLHNIGSFPWD